MVTPRRLFTLAALLLAAAPGRAENESYRIVTLDFPPEVTMEAGGLAVLPDGKLAVAIRRGEVWVAENPYAAEGAGVQWKRFASGLHEPLGLAFHDGALYTTQRTEVTKLRDTNGDGVADEYTCAAKGWGVSGAYHEYAYGPKFDPAGNMWITLNCTMGERFVPQRDWRGYALKITPDGEWKPVSGGMRSPCGIGINEAGDVFYSEQQGNWNCGGGVHHIRQGAFHGHQDSFLSVGLPGAPFPKPEKKFERIPVPEVAKQYPNYKPAAVWIPYRKMGMSDTDITLVKTGGKFGPFEGQFLLGEFTMSQINRVFLEKVNGEYQGACFQFMDGFQCGVLRMEFGQDGSLFVGETNRGWNSFGSRSYGVQRVLYSGRMPFEMQKMEAQPTGFRVTFTKPVTREAIDAAKWEMRSYTYEYHSEYGGPDIDVKELPVKIAALSPDGLAAELAIDNLRAGYVHELNITGLQSKDGAALAHPAAHYTLNSIPTK